MDHRNVRVAALLDKPAVAPQAVRRHSVVALDGAPACRVFFRPRRPGFPALRTVSRRHGYRFLDAATRLISRPRMVGDIDLRRVRVVVSRGAATGSRRVAVEQRSGGRSRRHGPVVEEAQEERRVRAGQGLQGRRRRRLLRRRRPADCQAGRRGKRRRGRRKQRRSRAHSRPRSARAIRQDEDCRRAGPNEQFARQAYAEGDRLFREKNYKAAAEQFKAAIDARPAFADRAGRDVHARRELLLRRPLHQGPRRLRRAW